MVQFARANAVSPGYIATEISKYIPPETKHIWRDKIPMGYAIPPLTRIFVADYHADVKEKHTS